VTPEENCVNSKPVRSALLSLTLCFAATFLPAAGTEDGSGPTTMSVWVLAGVQTDMYQKWKALYEAEHPDVQINITSHEAQAIQDVMTSALASGAEDLDLTFYWGGAAIDGWARDGLLLDLTEITKENGWYDKKNVGAKGYETDDLGNFYFTTDWVTVPHYFYRTDTFNKVGVAPPDSMAELFTLAAKLKSAGYEAWSAGVLTRWPIGGIFNDILARVMPKAQFEQFLNWERDPNRSQETAEVFRHPAAVEAWGYIKRLIDAEVFVKGANAMDDGAARTLFVDGTSAIYNSGSWTPGIFVNEAPDLEYNYFNLPPINGNVSIPAGYNGLVIPSYIDEKKLPVIIDFLNTSFGEEYARVVYEMGAIPDNTTVSASDFADIVHPIVRQIIEDVKTHGDVGIIDALQSPPHRQGYYDTIASIFEGNISPAQAAERMYQTAVDSLE
jgi:raffinose/stachyose/melibiose transport system substrate-binding protein